jgi:hypothetical protein
MFFAIALMPEHKPTQKRRTLLRLGRLGTLLIAGWGLPASARTSSATHPKSAHTPSTDAVASDQPIPTNPGYCIFPDGHISGISQFHENRQNTVLLYYRRS